jgi:CHAT domain-containing protein
LETACASDVSRQLNQIEKHQKVLSDLLYQINKSPATIEQKKDYFSFLLLVTNNTHDTDSIAPFIQYEYAKWLFGASKDYKGAADVFLKIFELQTSSAETIDSVFLARCLANAGMAFHYAGNIQLANRYIRQVIESNWPVTPKTLANMYQTIAKITSLNGNVGLAEDYYLQSGLRFMAISGDSMDLAWYGYNSIGILYYNFLNYEMALKKHLIALHILNRRVTSSTKVQTYIRNVKSNLANCYTKLGQYEAAMRIFKELLKSYDQANHVDDYIRTSLNLSNSLMKQLKLSEAELVLEVTDSLLHLHPRDDFQRLMIDNRAQLLRHQKKYQASLEIRKKQLRRCCQLELGELSNLSYDQYDNKTLIELYDILCFVGVIYRDQLADAEPHDGLLDSAFQLYVTASEVLDQVKLGLFDPDFSMDLGLLNADLLEEVLGLVQLHPEWSNRIYPFFEKAKSAALLASIRSSVVESHFENEFPIIKESRKLQREIDKLEQKLLGKQLPISQVDSLNQTILETKEQLVQVNRRKQNILGSGSAINQLYRYEDLKSLQSRVMVESAVLSYFVTQYDIYIMVIQKHNIHLFYKKNYAEFDDDIRTLITMNPQKLDNKQSWIMANDRLSEVLWGQELHDLPERIVIIPDGVLNYLPFEMLFSESVTHNQSWSFLPYLIKSKTISYNFSASIWKEMTEKEASGVGVLTMAPQFNIEIEAVNESRLITLPLVFAEKEVEDIRSIWNHEVQLVPKNKSEFMSQVAGASIVHFAGHALLNDHDSENSYLAFSSNDDNDDKLLIREIYNIKTPSELVVLSACNTGQGELKKGEGVMSLARSFAYAGAKSLVYSLWEVNDGSTRKIMKRFYQELKNGADKDVALRHAKLDYLDGTVGQSQHPFFWAGFVGMGDMSPIVTSQSWIYSLVGVLFLLSVLFFLGRRYYLKQNTAV